MGLTRAAGAHGVGDASADGFHDVFVGALGVEVPLPCVLEGVDLGAGFGSIFFGEQNVVEAVS